MELRKLMKTHQPNQNPEPDMLTEYDFSSKKGERGKYHQAYERGHTVHIVQEDGSVEVQYFMLEDGAVLPEPDVRKYFPEFGER